jgi:hypothetical protein
MSSTSAAFSVKLSRSCYRCGYVKSARGRPQVAATDAPQPTEKHPKDPENNPGANIAGASDYFRSILQMRACLSRSVCLLCHLFYCRGRRRSAKVTEIEVSLAHHTDTIGLALLDARLLRNRSSSSSQSASGRK